MSNSIIYFFVRFGNGILSIATLAYLTRLLSPSEYGIYALLVTISLTTSSIFFYWLTEAVGRFFPNHLQNPKVILAVIAKWFWISTAVVAALFMAAFPIYDRYKISPIILFAIFVLTIAYGRYTMALQIANSQNSPIRYGLLSLSKSALTFVFGVILIKLGFGGHGALIGFLVGLMLSVLLFEPHPRIGLPFGNVNVRISTDIIRYGLPLTLICIGGISVELIDRIMISSMLGISYVAPYAVVADFAQLSIGPVMNIFMLSTFPILVNFFDNERHEELNKCLNALGVKLISLGLPIVIALTVLSSDISKVLFGIQYQQNASILMPWLAGATFIGVFKSYYLDVAFQLHNVTKYQGYIAILMAIINIFFNLILLPRYGVIAAAWSTFAAYLFGAILSWLMGKNFLSLPNLSDVLLKSVIAGFFMMLVLYEMNSLGGFLWLLVKLLLGVVTYTTLALLLDVGGFYSFLRFRILILNRTK